MSTTALNVHSLFLAHGGPDLILRRDEHTRKLRELGARLKPHLKAVVIISAHFESHTGAIRIISRDDVYDTIHDFSGFGPELNSFMYPARGSTSVAQLVKSRLDAAGYKTELNSRRGLDHGAYNVLSHLFPDADVPVVAVSVMSEMPASEQLKIGAALTGLNREGVIVIGSGVTVHNFNEFDWNNQNGKPSAWAVEFDDFLVKAMGAEANHPRDLAALCDYTKRAPHAKRAVPTPEHFYPLLVAVGAGGEKTRTCVLHRAYELGSMSWLSLSFEEP